MFTISMDKRPLESLENDLDRFGEKTLPDAIRSTLNSAAYETSVQAKKEIGQQFIERNAYTQRSIRYKKAIGRDVNRMTADIGSMQKYMAEQEGGFTRVTRGRHGVAIPTANASGESGARIRRKAIRAAARLSRIRIAKGLAPEYARKYKRPRQRLIRMIQDSLEYGYRTIFWASKRSGRTGFYAIRGGKKRHGRGWPEGVNLEILYTVDKKSVITKPHEWLGPSTDKVSAGMDRLYLKALIREIDRQKNFRSK